ncbi:exocyst complex component 8-like isoform X2 [Lineus longissimus]|uniref:exocyst complex component 8-like isoform X2 n=1 Tax=Lineus longissimus TaxID=88925 RepID=UPI002B4E1AF9
MSSEGLGRVLSKSNFDADGFVKNVSQGGEDDLLYTRQKVQVLADDTALALKKNVYKNYSQFIETAKEISILEGEMYQLSHMLTEQKALLNVMKEMSLVSDKADTPKGEEEGEKKEDDTRQQNLAFLLEKVEGCSRVTEVPGRYLIHASDLTELDSETFSTIQRVHAFLLNDSIMIASWLPQRKGPVKYKYQALYELDNLAVVNVKDVGPVKNAFKILMFPDARMYQAETQKDKRQWLDVLEESKKKKMALDNQKRESVINLKLPESKSLNPFETGANPFEDSNPFDDEDEVDHTPVERPPPPDNHMLLLNWVQEVPEDLDVSIAQRDFEHAVEIITVVNQHLNSAPKTPALMEYRARIEHRVKTLTDVLVSELRVSPERSLRGGPRAARRAVTQLIKLGKSAQACDLFLKNRAAIIKYNLTQVKLEGASSLYIKKFCDVFFSGMTDTVKEFQKAFPDHHGCYSAFLVWIQEEMKEFSVMFRDQVFASNKVNLTTVAECVVIARQHTDELTELGLECTFVLNGLLQPDIEKLIIDNRDQLVEAGKHRAAEDLWRPMNLKTRSAMKIYVEELNEIGLAVVKNHVDDCSISLTNNTLSFSRLYLSFVDDMCKLYTEELQTYIVAALADVFKSQVKQYERSLKAKKFIKDHKFILNNATFLIETVLKLTEEKLRRKTGISSYQMYELHTAMRKLKTISKDATPEMV